MRAKNTTILIGGLFLLFLFACGDKNGAEEKGPADISELGNPSIDALTLKIKEDPDNAELYARRARAFYDNEGYDQAIRDLQQAIGIDSTTPGYYHLLADVYMDYFRSRQGLKTMEKAGNLFPDRIPTLLKLSEFQLILEEHENSMRTIDRILKQDPQNAEAYFMFGMNFKETGDTARAINSFQKAVELDPDLIDGWIILGKLQAETGSPLAEQYFDNALRIEPNNVLALHAKADYLTDHKDDLKGAIGLYQQINTIDPQYEESYYNAGLLYMELDSVEQGYQHFDLAIKASPLHIRAYFYRGYAAEMMGKIEQARKDYQQALKLAPNYELPRQRLEAMGAVQ